MRLGRLSLLRFGAFTDRDLVFPAPPPGQPDIHLIVGPNEAGKSTTLAAIEALLFGIPTQTPHNFHHPYDALRIGGRLEDGTGVLEVVRVKRRKNSVLTPEGAPLPDGEARIAALMGEVSLLTLQRMFTLTAERLRKGGEDMLLSAHDEVGQTLFAAEAGLPGLRARAQTLEETANALWGSRRKADRAHTQAEDRFKAAEAALREHTVTDREWRERHKARQAAHDACVALEARHKDTLATLQRLSRQRRVLRDVRALADLEARRIDMAAIRRLPADAGAVLEASRREAALAGRTLETLVAREAETRAERDALQPDTALLARADECHALTDRRAALEDTRRRLPTVLHDLAVAEADQRRLAAALGRAGDRETPIPSRADTARVRALLARAGGLTAALEAADAALRDAETRHAAQRRDLAALGEPRDPSPLAAILAAARADLDTGARLTLAADAATLAEAVARRLARLMPGLASATETNGTSESDTSRTSEGDATDARGSVRAVDALAAVRVPPRDAVVALRDDRRRLDEERRDHARRQREAEEARERLAREIARQTGEEGIVSTDALAHARRQRDHLWDSVRAAWQGQTPPPSDPETEATRLTHAIAEADALADRRFTQAEAAARLARTQADHARQNDLCAALDREGEALAQEDADLTARWQRLCPAEIPVPAGPDALLDWLAEREAVLGLAEQARAAHHRLAVVEGHARALAERLARGLTDLGLAAPSGPLAVGIEAATTALEGIRRREEERHRLQKALDAALDDLARRRHALDAARRHWAKWQEEWQNALIALGFPPSLAPDGATGRLDTLDALRDAAEAARRLREGDIARFQREADAFKAATLALVASVAPDLLVLAQDDPAQAVSILAQRLAEAVRQADQVKALEARLAQERAQARRAEESRAAALARLDPLMQAAGVTSVEALAPLIAQSDAGRAWEADRAAVLQRLENDGDGMPVSALIAECEGVDPDRLASEEDATRRALEDVNRDLAEARERSRAARLAFEALGGDDRAARAAAQRADAVDDLAAIAAAYVRAKGAVLLLQWGMERFRQERQGPLLRKAAEVFAALTRGAFVDLSVVLDEQDKPRLKGVRPSGQEVGIEGMSAGTADQLYLALRLASVSLALDQGAAVPFVADDLFLTFDDRRAEAGFAVLADLARKTQVLVFSHHPHLEPIARAAIGDPLGIQML